MHNHDPLLGLRELVAFLDGLGLSLSIERRAALAYDFLRRLGIEVYARQSPLVIPDGSPRSIRAAKKALGLTNADLRRDTGLSMRIVVEAQSLNRNVASRHADAIVEALVRRGARRNAGR